MKKQGEQNYATKMAIGELKEYDNWDRLVGWVRESMDAGVQVLREPLEDNIRNALHVYRASEFMQEVSRGKIKFDDIDVVGIADLIWNEGVK